MIYARVTICIVLSIKQAATVTIWIINSTIQDVIVIICIVLSTKKAVTVIICIVTSTIQVVIVTICIVLDTIHAEIRELFYSLSWIIKTRMHRSTYFCFWRWSPILCHCESGIEKMLSHSSNACKSVYIIKENTLKNNKAIFYDKLLFFIIRLKI